MTTVRDLRKGSYFSLEPTSESKDVQIWIRGLYDPSVKSFECYPFDEVCRPRYFDGSTQVYVLPIFTLNEVF